MVFKTLYRALTQKSKKFPPDALRTRVLIPTLITSLTELFLLTSVTLVALFWIERLVVRNSDIMGESAAQLSAQSLEKQLTENVRLHAEDMTNLIDEKLKNIQNYTILIATAATDYFSNPANYRYRNMQFVTDDEEYGGTGKTFVYISRRFDNAQTRREAAFAGNISDIFNQIYSLDSDITASYLAGESGYFITTRSNFIEMQNFDPRNRVWYRGTKYEEKLLWSPVYADVAGQGPTITCAAPFYDNSTEEHLLKGIAGNGVVLSNFASIINSAAPSDNTIVFLLDSMGNKLFSSNGTGMTVHPESGEIIKENLLQSSNIGMRRLAEYMMRGESGLMKIPDDKTTNYVAYYPLSTIDWSLGVEIRGDEITPLLTNIKADIATLAGAARSETHKTLIVSLVLLTILSVAILSYRIQSVFKLSKRIAEPISELVQQVEGTGIDNLNSEVKIHSKTAELKQLAKSFNTMKNRLREYLENLSVTTAEKERMSAELDVAAKIQISLLPKELEFDSETKDFFEIHAKMFSAKEVGGDFYDYFYIGKSRFAIIIGDVSGKGVSAAMFMITAKTLLKNHLREGLSPEDAITKLNLQLCENNPEGMFVTMWAGVLNPYNGQIEYVNAGHNPPLVKTGTYSFRYIAGTSNDLVVGVLETAVYHKRLLTLKKNSELFLYTDGITEAFNKNSNMYGEERLRDFLNSSFSLPLNNLLEGLYNDIKDFTISTNQSDDITMLALRYTKADRNEDPEELSELEEEAE